MNYNYLRYFSVLAQVEHYTLAAARLEISQPSLSSAIRALEDELGVKLFEKVGRNVRLTEQGRYFQKKVDSAMQELQDATETLMSSKDMAPIVIRLGFVSGSLHGVVAREMSALFRADERFRFHITDIIFLEKLPLFGILGRVVKKWCAVFVIIGHTEKFDQCLSFGHLLLLKLQHLSDLCQRGRQS